MDNTPKKAHDSIGYHIDKRTKNLDKSFLIMLKLHKKFRHYNVLQISIDRWTIEPKYKPFQLLSRCL